MIANNILSEDLKILVFRSDIDTSKKVTLAKCELLSINGIYRVDIDLDDTENVLRVECHPACRSDFIEMRLAKLGLECTELTYS